MKSRITLDSGRATITHLTDPPPPPPPPAEDPGWPYKPEREAIGEAIRSAVPHYLAIRAAGSTPAEGGPSFPLEDRRTEAFERAAGLALEFWPAATSFELVGSDSHFPPTRLASDGLPDTAMLLRLAKTILQFATKEEKRRAPTNYTPEPAEVLPPAPEG